MFDNKWQKKEMPLVSLIGMGGGIASPAFLASIVLNILKPTVFSPVDDTGVPDFDYNAESSAIMSVDQVVDNTPIVGSDENFNGGTLYAERLHSVYDPSTQRIVIAYTDWTNNEYGTYVVGQVDGDTITFGTPAAFRNQKCENIKTGYDPVNEKVYIAFVDGGHGGYVSVIAGDVDPTTNSINFGNYISLHGRGGGILGMAYDTTNQNMVVAYHDDTVHRGKIECVTMRDAASNLLGNGPQTEFGYGIVDNISNNGGISSNIVYDSNTNRIVIAYSGMDDYAGKVVVGEGTGGSWNTATVNFGSPVRFDNLGIYSGVTNGDSKRIRMVYNPDAQKIIIGYRFQHSFDNQASYTSNAQVIAGTVDPSTNTVNFGNSTVFGDLDPRELEIDYDSNSQKMILAYHPYIGGETNRIDFVAATIDGTTISVEDPVNIGTYSTIPYNTSIAYDSSNQKFVVSHTTNATGGISNVVSLVSTATQLTLTDTTVSRVSDGSLIGGTSIDQVLTVGETVQADTAAASTVSIPVFDSHLYTGTGNSTTITNGIDLAGEGGMVWIKWTSGGAYSVESHCLMDTERSSGSASDQYGTFTPFLRPNQDVAQQNAYYLNFNSDGYEIDAASSLVNHDSGGQYVGWTFGKAPGFFDIVKWNASDLTTGDYMVNHNLGTTPGMIICKNLDNGGAPWYVYHKHAINSSSSDPNAHFFKLSETREAIYSSGMSDPNSDFGGWAVTDTQFRASGSLGLDNGSDDFIAYVFAEDTPGLIKCGSYTGAGASTQVNVGFQPRWMMIKRADSTGNWVILDKDMDDHTYLKANSDDPQGGVIWNFTSTGVTLVGEWGSLNNSGGQYTYIAISENAETDITIQSTATGEVSASSGNTITLSNTTGTWSTGMKVQGATTDTKDNPDAIKVEDVSLTSSAPTAERNVNTWGDAMWEIATDENFTQNVQTATTVLSATGTQAGPSFTLERETGYYTRTKYTALGQESEWSDVTYFVTKALPVYADDLFSTTLWSGTGSAHEIVTGIDNTANTLIWTKSRNYGNSHRLYTPAVNTIMGHDAVLYSNIANNPGSLGSQDVTGFTANGFTVGDEPNANTGMINSSNLDYVAWNFKAAPGFFDVVTWTGTNDGTRISHNLGSLPGMIMVKNLDSYTENWRVYAKKEMWIDGETYAYYTLSLNTNGGNSQSVANIANADTFNPQSMGSEASGTRYVAYLFADNDARFGTNGDESIIKCGSYTGNGSTDGPEIDLGFEPQFLLYKNITQATKWEMIDTMRGMPNSTPNNYMRVLSPNTSSAEGTDFSTHPTPTGFKITNNGASNNGTNNQYVYIAIRRPHRPATIATDVFDVGLRSGSGSDAKTNSSILTDMTFVLRRNSSSEYNGIGSRLMGPDVLQLNSDSPPIGGWLDSTAPWANMTGAMINGGNGAANTGNLIDYSFKRSPGFFDVVKYTGNGSSPHSIPHNLGVEPEMMWVKNTTQYASGRDWMVYMSGATGTNQTYVGNVFDQTHKAYLSLNKTDGAGFNNQNWKGVAPTSTHFTVGSGVYTNESSRDHIVYLFASQPGISKVGWYVGSTGSNIDVDCGFTAGSRFVMIKRLDAHSDWYVWNAERGIVSGSDPYMKTNTTDQEFTGDDYIDPLNAGFTITSSAPADLNQNGGQYLFLAIA